MAVTLNACATNDNGAARIPSGGNDCFWADNIHGWKAQDGQRLIIWSPTRQSAYQVDLARHCNGLLFTNEIGFQDRDGRICPYGGDAIVILGPAPDRCSIASIKRLDESELEAVLATGPDAPNDGSNVIGNNAQVPIPEPESAAITAADFSAAETWGAASNVVGIKHLYFSTQPDNKTLVDAHDRGVGVVIDLREPSESDWDEAGAAKDSNMTYYNVPITAAGTSFDAAAMQEISALVGKHNDTKVLLHCSSGNRASAWFAIHLVHDHGMDVSSSLVLARKAGLTSPVIEARVREYLSAEEQSPHRSE